MRLDSHFHACNESYPFRKPRAGGSPLPNRPNKHLIESCLVDLERDLRDPKTEHLNYPNVYWFRILLLGGHISGVLTVGPPLDSEDRYVPTDTRYVTCKRYIGMI